MPCNVSVSSVSQSKHVLQQYFILVFVEKAAFSAITDPLLQLHCTDVKHLVLPFINQETRNPEKQRTSPTDNLIVPKCFQSQNSLVVSKELDPHPAPEVEEDVDRDGDRQQQAVETQTVAAGAALREVLIHRSRVEQTKERDYRDQPHHHGQGEHPDTGDDWRK